METPYEQAFLFVLIYPEHLEQCQVNKSIQVKFNLMIMWLGNQIEPILIEYDKLKCAYYDDFFLMILLLNCLAIIWECTQSREQDSS